jgi:hypothetical protein
MSWIGAGNAAAGVAAVHLITAAFTKEENKPATKKDVQNLANKLRRFERVNNMKPDIFGKLPYFDAASGMIVYR